jgi:methyl-accepting chemotaxis protein
MRLRDISIAIKLFFAFGMVLFFLALITAVSWQRFASVTSEVDQAKYLTHLHENMLNREIDHLKFVNQAGSFFSDQAVVKIEVQTDDHQCALGKWLYGDERKIAEQKYSDLAPLFRKIEEPHAHLHKSIVEMNELAGKQEKAAALPGIQKIFETKTKGFLVQVQDTLKETIAIIDSTQDKAHTDVERSIATGKNLIMTFAALSLTVGLALCFLISRSISGTTRQLAGLTEKLAKGDMTTRSTLDQKDEMGQLACSTNILASSLSNMCSRVHCASSTINGSSQNLTKLANSLYSATEIMSGSCNTVAAAAEQMTSNMTAIAAAAEETSTNVSMVATAAEEMTATISEIASGSEKARIITLQAVQEAAKATTSVAELGDSAKLISKVTETINEIADQTNLLALNATIEAARAGEAGKGFAVVANEIKELAKQTTAATREIHERIENVQKSSEQTINVINGIAGIINSTSEIVTSMAAAVEEQAVTSREIASNVSEASVGMKEVTENIAQASTANAEVTKDIANVRNEALKVAAGSSDVRELAVEMNNNGVDLARLLDRFSFKEPQFDIGKIKAAHFNWKMRLTAVLSGFTTMEAKDIPNSHQCDFGKWYDNAPSNVKSHPLFKEIGIHHDAVHVKVMEAVDYFNANKVAEAKRKVEEFEEVRKKLFAGLDEMYVS